MATLIISQSKKRPLNIPDEKGIVFDTTKGSITKFFRESFWSKFYGPKKMHLQKDTKCIILHEISDTEDNFNDCLESLKCLLEINDFKNETNILHWLTCYNGFASEFNWTSYQESLQLIPDLGDKTLFRKILLSKQLESAAYINDDDFPKQISEVVRFLTIQPYDVLDKKSINEDNVYFSIGIGRLMSPIKKAKDIIHNYAYAKNLFNLLKPIDQDHFERFFSEHTEGVEVKSIEDILEKEFKEKEPHREAVELTLKHFWEDNLQDTANKVNCKEQLFSEFYNNVDSNFHFDFDELKRSITNKPNSLNKKTSKLVSTKLESIKNSYTKFKSSVLQSEIELRNSKEEKERTVINSIDSFSTEVLNTTLKVKVKDQSIQPDFGNVSRISILHHILSVFSVKDSNYEAVFTQGDNYTLNQLTNEFQLGTARERMIERTKLRHNFELKKINSVQSLSIIYDELEETDGSLDELKEAKEQVLLGVYDDNLPLLKGRYSKLTNWIVITILSILIFNGLTYGIGRLIEGIPLLVYLVVSIIPLVIGGIKIWQLFSIFNAKKRHVENLVLNISNELTDIINLHNSYIKDYLEQVRKDHLARLVNGLNRNVNIRISRLKVFREYVLRHVLLSIEHYQLILKQESDFVNYFPPFSEVDEDTLKEDKGDYFTANPNEINELYSAFKEKARKEEERSETPVVNFNMLQEGIASEEVVRASIRDANQLEYQKVKEFLPVLFQNSNKDENAISYTDIKQGAIGNCYFLAALGAFSVSNKGFLKSMVFESTKELAKNINKTSELANDYMVRLFDNEGQECYVAVDDKFWYYNNSKSLAYAGYGDIVEKKAEIWPMVIEKAWAKANGGFENIIGGRTDGNDERNYTDYCMSIAGSSMKSIFLETSNKDEIIDTLNTYLNISKYPITCGSQAWNNQGDSFKNEEGVVSRHAYFISRFDINKNEIDILNPHGKDHLLSKDIDFFIRNFEAISIFTPVVSDRNFDPEYQYQIVEHIKKIEDQLNSAMQNRVENVVRLLPSIVPNDVSILSDNIELLNAVSKPMFTAPEFNNCISEKIMWGNDEYKQSAHYPNDNGMNEDQNEVGMVQIVRFEVKNEEAVVNDKKKANR